MSLHIDVSTTSGDIVSGFVLSANERIESLRKQLDERSMDKGSRKLTEMMGILTETVENLACTIDEIDKRDMEITEEVEDGIRGELRRAIANINKASALLGE